MLHPYLTLPYELSITGTNQPVIVSAVDTATVESSTTPGRFRDRVRRQLRDDVLDTAYDITVANGWNSLRMTTLADRVGVSRQTLYKEFGSKEEVGRALVIREAGRLIDGVTEQIKRHDDVPSAIHAALLYALERSAASPLLRAVLTGSGLSGDSLLPIITQQSRALIATATALLSNYLRARTPGLSDEDAGTIASALVRLTASHLMLPLDPPGRTATRLTRMAVSALAGLPAGIPTEVRHAHDIHRDHGGAGQAGR
jgi:AcrR family transcriptional regulator